MKKTLPILLILLLFLSSVSIRPVFALNNEKLEFYYQSQIYTYTLSENIKQSNQFDLNYKINKFKRFTTKTERQNLLAHLISINLDNDICLEYLFPNLKKTINTMEKCINKTAKNATLKINSNSKYVFYITPETIGKQIDVQALYNKIINAYLSNEPLQFNLPIITKTPAITSQDYKKITNLRADFSTSIETSSSDRKHNIKNALNSINKVEIMPNNTFSFNKTVGKRTETNGYRNAKIIINNEYVDGIGGGVCQVSSTLYNAALLAGLEIIEANKHSKQISYVKQGFDAMVNFGSSDLIFKNNTNEKLTIITNYSNSNIRIRIYGETLNNTHYKLTNEILNIIEPKEEKFTDTEFKYSDKVMYEDEYFYLKKATRGLTVKSYREKYVNNTLVEKQLLREDVFAPQNAVKIFGSLPRPMASDLTA